MRHPTLHRWLLRLLLGNVCNRRWYRRWQGGHWERWWIEPCWSDLWLDMPKGCYHDDHARRPGAARGQPTCEDWPVA